MPLKISLGVKTDNLFFLSHLAARKSMLKSLKNAPVAVWPCILLLNLDFETDLENFLLSGDLRLTPATPLMTLKA